MEEKNERVVTNKAQRHTHQHHNAQEREKRRGRGRAPPTSSITYIFSRASKNNIFQ